MKDINIKENTAKIKTYISGMSKKKKTMLFAIAGAVVLMAVIATIVMNSAKGNYVTLYSDLSASEAGNVYQALLDMGADTKIGGDGSILVQKDEYDIWILQLAARGYPKTALPYDIFSSHSGMTSTESEKAQWLLYQLQDRIQATLERMDCVESATVTINIPQTSDYVWEKATNKEKASAGVLLALRKDFVISGEQVSAIRNLVAASVPNMQAEDVMVVDSSTMLELSPTDGSESGSGGNLAFELMVQKQIEDNVVRLLSPRYGTTGVVAVAKVTIDYDKMMTEKYELTPNEEGEGFVKHNEEDYSVNGGVPAGELVGEENNTDIPQYGYNSPDGENGMTNYSQSTDFDYGYIKTQIESGNAILKRATVSVMVNESSLTPARREELTSLVSGCTDIPTELIFVSAFNLPVSDERPSGEETPERDLPSFLDLPLWVYIVSGVGLILILILILVVVTIVKRKKREKLRAKAEAEELARLEEERRQQEEIEKYKKSLEVMAKGNIDPKDEAIMDEVRNFAKENPQVTANLLRSWLKEE